MKPIKQPRSAQPVCFSLKTQRYFSSPQFKSSVSSLKQVGKRECRQFMYVFFSRISEMCINECDEIAFAL